MICAKESKEDVKMASIIQKIVAFFMSILATFGLFSGKPEPDVKVGNAGYRIDKQIIEFSFKANTSTGFTWSYETEGDDGVLEMTGEDYVTDKKSGNMVGVGGTQYYTFKAQNPGKTTITFSYARSFEENSTIEQYVAVINVSDDLSITVDSFTQK